VTPRRKVATVGSLQGLETMVGTGFLCTHLQRCTARRD